MTRLRGAGKNTFGSEWVSSPFKRWRQRTETTSADLNKAWYSHSEERGRVVVLEKDRKGFLDPATPLNKTFTFEKELGFGEMSVEVSLWRGNGNKLFAIKKFSDCGSTAAIDHEFQIGLDLDHEGIAKSFHCVRKHEQGTYFDYLVMEYVNGQTISAWFTTHKKFDNLLPQVQRALTHMGERRIWPADLNGQNLMVTTSEKLKFIDLGFYYRPDDVYSASSSSEDEDSQDNIITINLRTGKTHRHDVSGGHF